MGRISTIITREQIPIIEQQRGYIDEYCCILPIEGKMMLLESEDGQLLIDGEGYLASDILDAEHILVELRSKRKLKWDKTHHYHKMPMPIIAEESDIRLCHQAGFSIFKIRKNDRGWMALVDLHVRPLDQAYVAGRIIGGKLFIVGNKSPLYARVPEEAVGYCYCSEFWGDSAGSDYALAAVDDWHRMSQSEKYPVLF